MSGTYLKENLTERISHAIASGEQQVVALATKNQTIKQTLQATRARWKTQVCRVYELKLTKAKLSPRSRAHLARLFLEGKWFYNWIVSQADVLDVVTKVQSVPVKVGAAFEDRPLMCLSSQMKQGLVTKTQHSFRLCKLGQGTRKPRCFSVR